MQNVVVITGASRGIGAATAELFAEKDYAVCINYKTNAQAADSVAEKLRSRGAKVITAQADVSSEAEVVRLFNRVDAELGPISTLVNNAGILAQQCRVEDLSAERINQILTTNVTGYFLCCREAVKRMSSKNGGKGGSIVNVSSGASRTGSPNEYVDYAASKGAVDTLTKGLSVEVASEGVRVNCVRPGLIYTDMHADGGEPGRVDRLAGRLPLGRGGLPSEVAQAIYWLASEQASFSTGCFVDVTGGF